ncbi:LOG family protein [Candidatus Williamhamiltonella defendens]|nr:LOG family protein [Candidatus Hamiltonella defensa]
MPAKGIILIVNINPLGSMDLLSHLEVDMLKQTQNTYLYDLFRHCALAVLSSGSQTDDSKELLSRYEDFRINILRHERGIELELINPPAAALIDQKIMKLLQANLFSVLRDILFLQGKMSETPFLQDSTASVYLTNQVFSILRHARALHTHQEPNLIVCWGGHSINTQEYLYAHQVGHQLGLRELNICTGCGPGIMEAPMKGAAIGHAQQLYKKGRFIGITEPSIIASEPPNPMVNELIIMPDIEKRLEAFVRMAHGIIIFPGGVGTAEEFLYLLSILMDVKNRHQILPLILTGPEESAEYFNALNTFVIETLGPQACRFYQIMIGQEQEVAQKMKKMMKKVKENRCYTKDAYSFNWSIHINEKQQHPFNPTHQNMADLNLKCDQAPEALAAALRCAFSGIVAGNVKEKAIQAVKTQGPFKLKADPDMLQQLAQLLENFIHQGRMKLTGTAYQPCYEIDISSTFVDQL